MSRRSDQPIRVLVVEDPRTQRPLLAGLLRASSDFVVVGTASDGKAAIAATQRLRPNVIAMDIHLPILDGYEATRQIMQQCPTPIVLISSYGEISAHSIEALAVGALAVVNKPQGPIGATVSLTIDDDQAAFLTTLRLMADVRVVTRYPPRRPIKDHRPPTTDHRPPTTEGRGSKIEDSTVAGDETPSSILHPPSSDHSSVVGRRSSVVVPRVLAIAASTGGPAAVQQVLRGLGAGFPLPILIVQHIARGFVPALAEWLNNTVPLPVRMAYHGERIRSGQIYLAPEDSHLMLRESSIISLRSNAASDRYCPSADLLFESVAQVYGARAIGLVLTGMGDDGTRGLLVLRTVGATTLAQDAASCVVYGMPRAAVEAGAITRVEPLAAIAETIVGLASGGVRDMGGP